MSAQARKVLKLAVAVALAVAAVGFVSKRVGGYHVSERWLKERKDRMLGRDEIEHYPHFVAALSEARTLIE